jgi:long-chain acyl-CoA synthetase
MPDEQPTTLPELFLSGVKKHSNPQLFNYKGIDRKWHSMSSEEVQSRVRHLALGFYLEGVRFGDRVVLLSENRPEWCIVDLALLSIGAVVVPIYTNQPSNQIEFIFSNAEPVLAVISNRALYDRALQALEKQNFFERVVVFQTVPPIPRALLLDNLEKAGKKLDKEKPNLYEALKSAVKEETLASIVYTSDQSGIPKGVMLTHKNFVSNVLASVSFFPTRSEKDVALSYLPLSHVFERTILYHYLYKGVSVFFAESVERVAENLREVKPTILTTVPRLLEKVEERILAKARKLPFFGKLVFHACMKIAQKFNPEIPPSFFYRLAHKVADVVLYARLRKQFGGRLASIISGGARLKPELASLFTAAGMPVYQGYGLTETSPVISTNYPGKNRIGSVGQVLPGVDVKIAEDGEIWVKGPNVMQGYYKNEEATRRVLEDGWFKTGDIGCFDADGFLYIVDRKKDLMKTSGGKYVAPQVIESLLTQNPYVEKAVAVADGRKFVSALLFPSKKALEQIAKEKKLHGLSCEELVKHPEVKVIYDEVVANANKSLSHWEAIKKFAVICDNISDLNSENLTLRQLRKKLQERYRDRIEAFYAPGVEKDVHIPD